MKKRRKNFIARHVLPAGLLILAAMAVAAPAFSAPYCDYHIAGQYGRCYKNFTPKFPGDRPIAGRDDPDPASPSAGAAIAAGGCAAGIAGAVITKRPGLGAATCAGSIALGFGVDSANATEQTVLNEDADETEQEQ